MDGSSVKYNVLNPYAVFHLFTLALLVYVHGVLLCLVALLLSRVPVGVAISEAVVLFQTVLSSGSYALHRKFLIVGNSAAHTAHSALGWRVRGPAGEGVE
ncbi:hypothetical protein GDO81_023482 [Engystomops pustulosus]|uniref:Uncharacterized protein n=1 Tax=Engystomops pustulosus TaxID=76066 RepID=A0AAV6YS55_ENGPU|nr:hypothetical protein GDO81_023482 [Engystomops pustulosus]